MNSQQQGENLGEIAHVSSADFGIKTKTVDLKTLTSCLPYYQFSFISNQLLRKMTNSQPPEIYKILRGVCKLMELNEFEIVYWHLLNTYFDFGQQLSPKYQLQIKIVAFNGFKDFLQVLEVENLAQYKRQLLFTTLSAFHILSYLRNEQKIDKITEFIKEETFIKLLQFIQPAFDDAGKIITIQKINQMFQKLMQPEESIDDSINYNFIVDQIIEMAPAYQKDEDIPQTKKVKRQKKLMQKKSQQNTKEQDSGHQQIQLQQQQLQQQQQQQQQQQDEQAPYFRQNSGMFLRSSQPIFKYNSIESLLNQNSVNQFFLNPSSRFNLLSKKEFK